MIKKLKNLLEGELEETPARDEIQLAAAALMIEVMRSDNEIAAEELDRISVLLGAQFKLDKSDTRELIDLAHGKVKKSVSLLNFTKEIRKSWTNAERVFLLQQLWSVAYADGRVDSHERHVIRKIGALLYLTERQIYAAKERARKEMAA
jgi:uncharacterized tellurite resistance protein B-like protein